MKKLLLILVVIMTLSITVDAKSNHRKLKHQNEMFQRYLQSSVDNKGTYSWSFRPRGQSFIPKIKFPELYVRAKRSNKTIKKVDSSNTYTSMK